MTSLVGKAEALIAKCVPGGAEFPLGAIWAGSLSWWACGFLGVSEFTPLWFGMMTAFNVVLLPLMWFVFWRLIRLCERALKVRA